VRRLTAHLVAALLGTAGCYAPANFSLPDPPADPPPPSGTPMACEAAVQRALDDHPAVVAARARSAVAAADARGASGWPSPELRMRTDAALEDTRVEMRLRLPERAGTGQALAAGARAEQRSAQAATAATRVELARVLRALHLNVRRAQANLTHRAARVTFAERRLAASSARALAGTVTALGEERARLNLARERVEYTRLEADARASMAIATRWLGAPPDGAPCGPLPTDGAVEHPTEVAAREAVAATHAQGYAQAGAGWFWPTFVEAAWDQRAEQDDRILFGVGVALPFLGPESSAGASARVQAARAEWGAVRRSVADQRVAAKARFDAAAAAHDAARLDLKRAHALTARASEVGAAAEETLELQQALAEAQHASTLAKLRAEAAAIELRAALGRE
jgi:hypothetical protein